LAFLIDTNIAIDLGEGIKNVLEKFDQHEGVVFMSALTLAELQRGLFKNSSHFALRQLRLSKLMKYIPVIPFGPEAAEAYGQIIAQCGWVKGRDFDRMIAAHAMSLNAVFVTNNAADFRDIPGLKIENWAVV
jgi:tRNA(fMet)-specific endonuclease VapC